MSHVCPPRTLCRALLLALVLPAFVQASTLAQVSTPISFMLEDPVPQQGGLFGRDVHIADLDLDGDGELIVGAPGNDVNGTPGSREGEILIFPGPVLPTTTPIRLTRPLAFGGPQGGSEFGFRIVSGNFNNDMFPDLAISAPNAEVNPINSVPEGEVIVLYGSWNFSGGPVYNGGVVQLVDPAPNLLSPLSDRFGHRMATGDFDLDDYDDLIVGSPFSDAGISSQAYGQAFVFFGADLPPGFQAALEIPDPSPAPDKLWGFDVAAGNVAEIDTSACDDVLIGAYNAEIQAESNAGLMRVYYDYPATGAFDLARSIQRLQHLGPHEGQDWGWSISVGNWDNVPPLDFAVGGPAGFGIGERLGLVQLFLGVTSAMVFPHALTLVANPAEPDPFTDRFGSDVVLLDQNADGRSELLVGAPFYSAVTPPPPDTGPGRAFLYANGGSLTATFDDPTPEYTFEHYGFGAEMAVGMLRIGARDDLAIGNARARINGLGEAGEVRVAIYNY